MVCCIECARAGGDAHPLTDYYQRWICVGGGFGGVERRVERDGGAELGEGEVR